MAVMTIKTGMWDDFFGCTLALTEEYDKLESYHDLRTSELPQKPLQNLLFPVVIEITLLKIKHKF